ncbi:unnamed protein product [Schistosoma mattheei]|uniref:Uncharacterized protein n=1 Tax=Schistosoma mattheei TaxID=31246 RepID=A0A183Q053_9TREM|nr:unnamed protein product [Schistosoma mattheei]
MLHGVQGNHMEDDYYNFHDDKNLPLPKEDGMDIQVDRYAFVHPVENVAIVALDTMMDLDHPIRNALVVRNYNAANDLDFHHTDPIVHSY